MAKGRGQLLNSFVFYFQDFQRLIWHWNLTVFRLNLRSWAFKSWCLPFHQFWCIFKHENHTGGPSWRFHAWPRSTANKCFCSFENDSTIPFPNPGSRKWIPNPSLNPGNPRDPGNSVIYCRHPGLIYIHTYNYVQFRVNVGVWRSCEKSKSRHYVCKATFSISPPIRGKRISQVCRLLIVYRSYSAIFSYKYIFFQESKIGWTLQLILWCAGSILGRKVTTPLTSLSEP